jgi:hypothetical protein
MFSSRAALILWSGLYLSCAGPVHAATKKALFDNAHAETAGNADWQIDTDQPVPLPDQAGVTPSTPRTYWLGAISSWAIDLVKRGYQVATNTGALAYGNPANPYDLKNWDVLVVDEPNTQFTAAESTAIFNFVREGGGLVMVIDHDNSDRNGDGFDSPKIWNALDAQLLFGIHAQSTNETNRNITQDSGNVETSPSDSIIHGPNGVADSLSFHNGTTFVLHPETNPRVRGLVWMNGLAHGNSGVMAARSEYGNGRLVIVGDSSPADDGSAAPGNSSIFDGWAEASGRDSLLFQNATIWATRRDAALVDVSGASGPASLAFVKPAPNPSAGPITLRFALPRAARARIEILDAQGRKVRAAALGDRSAGFQSWTWDGRRDDGRRAAPGVYTARLTTSYGRATQRIVRVR